MKIVRDIVVIGAGLGSLSTIARLASSWPKELPVAVLIALATQGQPSETVLQIIDSYAPFQVASAINGEPIKPGHIYVSPHSKHLSIGRPGVVRIDEPSFFDNVHPSINRLFFAAAVVYGSRVIAVVLSGNQYDGVQGLREVESAGDVSIVQDPGDASALQMPRHAINNDHPHYTLKAAGIVPLVRRLIAGEV